MAQKITLSNAVTSSSVSRAVDIVLVDKKTKTITKLKPIHAEVTLDFEELSQPIDNAAEAGFSVYRITGDIVLYQNLNAAADAVALHEGTLYDVHILLSNGEAISTNTVGTSIKVPARLKERYQNIETFKDFYGIGLKIADKSGAPDRGIHLLVTGSTAIKLHWTPSTSSQFYTALGGTSTASGSSS